MESHRQSVRTESVLDASTSQGGQPSTRMSDYGTLGVRLSDITAKASQPRNASSPAGMELQQGRDTTDWIGPNDGYTHST